MWWCSEPPAPAREHAFLEEEAFGLAFLFRPGGRVSREGGGRAGMVDHRADEASRSLHHRDHIAWLQEQHADLQEHRRSHEASMRDEQDYAVGHEAYGFESAPSFVMEDDDEVRYRSLSMPTAFIAEHSPEVDLADELVYRSLPVLGRQQSDSSSNAGADADATWLAAGRPPLLQRQRAFNRPDDTAALLGL